MLRFLIIAFVYSVEIKYFLMQSPYLLKNEIGTNFLNERTIESKSVTLIFFFFLVDNLRNNQKCSTIYFRNGILD